MVLVPITRDVVNGFLNRRHRHHGRVVGYKFAIGCEVDEKLVGVAVVGRPVSRMLDDGRTAELTRLCSDGTHNVCSKLLGASWRAAKAMGYLRLVTYTLPEESGSSLRAAGFQLVKTTKGGKWSRESRPREDKHPTGEKLRWQITSTRSTVSSTAGGRRGG